MSGDLFEEAFQYYLTHQDELVKQHDGRVVAIANGEILGVFDDELEAITEMQKTRELGTFLLQRVSAGVTAYSHTFHSRVTFPLA